MAGWGRQRVRQPSAQRGKQRLQWGQPGLLQALQHCTARHADRGKAPQRLRRQQARQGVVAAQSLQHGPQQSQPEMGLGYLNGTTPTPTRGQLGGGNGLAALLWPLGQTGQGAAYLFTYLVTRDGGQRWCRYDIIHRKEAPFTLNT